MAVAGALDPVVEEKLNLRVPRPFAGVRAGDRARRDPRDLRGDRACGRRSRLRRARGSAAGRLGPLRRGRRLSGARRDRLSRARDHAAGPGEAVRRALPRRRRARRRLAHGGRHSRRRRSWSNSSGRRSTRRANWTCPTSRGSRSTTSPPRWSAASTAAAPGRSIASFAASGCARSFETGLRSSAQAAAPCGPEAAGELHQREVISHRRAVRAVVARDDDLQQLDHDLAVDLGQMVERQAGVIERRNQRLSQSLESPDVAADQRAPDASMEAGHRRGRARRRPTAGNMSQTAGRRSAAPTIAAIQRNLRRNRS